ncbi:hypothetical protein BHE97_18555 [Aeromicrobium sp. PE09-221]|uniref:hypothetical protein n=1 Tax=Aeromicrobium sp. PE09-221 TaxID=1898043 RepID=UPI000B3EC4BD|nr:hypothetical protein [Aeromicrobium sp. PE09-221]OUZ06746.1 hypothetical protein BHE97_18555 [Aeromicrobium sp. PE09-221]
MTTKTATKKTATTAPKTLKDAATAGAVRLFRQRKNGTLRSLPYLSPGSDQRTQAEAVAARRDKGETAASIADDLNLSIATVRRMITNLLLAQQIENGEHADRYTPGETKVVISTVGEDAA